MAFCLESCPGGYVNKEGSCITYRRCTTGLYEDFSTGSCFSTCPEK